MLAVSVAGLRRYLAFGVAREPLAFRANPDAGLVSVDEFPVLDARALYERTNTWPIVRALRIKFGLPPEAFDALVLPVIERFVEFVQLCPALGAGAPDEFGGLLKAALAGVHRALDADRSHTGFVVATSEEPGAPMQRARFVLFLVALMTSVPQSLGRLRITYRAPAVREERVWNPLCGSLRAHGARSYRIGAQRSECPDTATTHFPAFLCVRIVHESTLAWIAEDQALFRALLMGLAGAMPAAVESATSREWVRHADSEPGHLGTDARARADRGSREPPNASTSARPAGAAPDAEAAPSVHDAGLVDGPVPETPIEHRLASDLVPSTAESVPGPVTSDPEHLPIHTGTRSRASPHASRHAPGDGADLFGIARRFMDWIAAGLASGSLRCNESRALVHRVSEGLLLVTPRVFIEFEKSIDADFARLDAFERSARIRTLTRNVLRVGLHLIAHPQGGIVTYDVVRQGCVVSQRSGIVIVHPERFIAELPAINPLLVCARARKVQAPSWLTDP